MYTKKFINFFLIVILVFLKFSSSKFFSLEFFSSKFSSSEFSLSESEEISISSVLYFGIFFSLTTYLILLKTIEDNNLYLF